MKQAPHPKPLAQKLGLKADFKACFLNSPSDYFETSLFFLPEPLTITDELSEGPFDFIQLFAREGSELDRLFPQLISAIQAQGMIWISWPKKTAPGPRNIELQAIRHAAQDLRLAESKMCAINAVWSAIKFTLRKADRK